MALQALMSGAALEQLPMELAAQVSALIGNSAMADLVQHRADRLEVPSQSFAGAPLDTPPAAVASAEPVLVQPPAGFGGAEG